MYVNGEQVLWIRENVPVYVVSDSGEGQIIVNVGKGFPSFYLFWDEVRKLTKLDKALR